MERDRERERGSDGGRENQREMGEREGEPGGRKIVIGRERDGERVSDVETGRKRERWGRGISGN